jgi:M6 family metalloprotease-like protein
MNGSNLLIGAILAGLLACGLVGVASGVPPAAGGSWDGYVPSEMPRLACAEFRMTDGVTVLSAMEPVTGTRPLLVLLVASSDTPPNATHDAAYFENLCFGPKPSMADFYTENSYGAFTFSKAAVLDPGNDGLAPFWYQSTYTTAEIANDRTKRLAMVGWAIRQAAADLDFAAYDANHNGQVVSEELAIFIITTGKGREIGGTAVWGHCSVAPPVTCDGVVIGGTYAMCAEVDLPNGAIAHELGHQLGLPDLYDTTPLSNPDSDGIGHYGLMGSGSYCGPTHLTAWEKTLLGWMHPLVAPGDGSYDLRDAETHPDAYVLWNPARSTTEYFLVENRWRGSSYDARVGREGYLPDEGIVIYHIDEQYAKSLVQGPYNQVNANEAHKGVDVECADWPSSHYVDADDLDCKRNRGDAGDLWDATAYELTDSSSPCSARWYDGTASGIRVFDLPTAGPTMRVSLDVPTSGIFPLVTSVSPNSGAQGSTVHLTVNGTGFVSGAAVQLEQAPFRINGTNVVVQSQERLSCDVVLPADATRGWYRIEVYNPDGYHGGHWDMFQVTDIAPRQIPGAPNLPRDLDGDGKYEDVNGNGRKDFADVTLYFTQMTWIGANEPLPAFDYNGNGRIDFADVTWIFNRL